jgi:D-lactate dehydrogenase
LSFEPKNKTSFDIAFSKIKKGMMLINTSRGAIINTKDAIEALKRHKWIFGY